MHPCYYNRRWPRWKWWRRQLMQWIQKYNAVIPTQSVKWSMLSKNCNDSNEIGRVVCVVENIENLANPKITLLTEAPNAFFLICSCDIFTLITSNYSIWTNVNLLQGVYLLRCTIILNNECHQQFNSSWRHAQILDG